MHKIFRDVAFFSTMLLCCSASPQSHVDTPSIYPYWNADQLPVGPVPLVGTPRMPMPVGSAVLIAPGYLLGSFETMGDVAEDLNKDERVHVFDGKDWHVGRYVDYDRRLKLALIRADVPGKPVTIAPKSEGVLRLMAIPWAKSQESPVVLQQSALDPCDAVPDSMYEILGRMRIGPAYCFKGQVRTLSGGALIDAEGRFAGLQVEQVGSRLHAGSNVDDIRAFVESYFSSWGSGVKNKPKL